MMIKALEFVWILFVLGNCLFLLYKCTEIIFDMHWMLQHGRAYALQGLATLEIGESINFDELDHSFNRRQPLWNWCRRHGAWARGFGDFIFRVPSLMLMIAVLLLSNPSAENLRWLLILTIISTCAGVVITVINAFIQLVQLGQLDAFKRDWRWMPTSRYHLVAPDVTSSSALKRRLLFLLLLVYLSVFGFATAYLALDRLSPAAFNSSSSWSFLDALYFSSVTMGTIGYGDLLPVTSPARLLVTVQIFSGPIILSILLLAFTDSAVSTVDKDRTHAR